MKQYIRGLLVLWGIGVLAITPHVVDAQERTEVTIGALRGPTGVGIASALMEQPVRGEYASVSVEVVPEPSVMVGRLAAGEIQIGMLPSNVGAQLYNRGIPVQVAAVTLWGLLYVVSSEEGIDGWGDLAGRRVNAISRGAGPDIMLRHILSARGLDPDDDVDLDYRYGHVELAQMLIAGEVATAVLPEPFVTQVLSRRDDLSVTLDFQRAWSDLYGDAYPQTVVLVRRDWAAEHPEAVAEALGVIESGWRRTLADPEEAGRMVEEAGLGLPGNVVEAALPRFNARYVPAGDVGDRLLEYFQVLYDAEPRAVGGSVPDRGILYLPR
ncbi:MAG: ABC transporter substrate-binding protein [Alkalispirochaeta sp.]